MMEPTEEEQVFVTSIAWSVKERRYDGPPIVRDKPLAANGPNEASTTAVRDKKRKKQNVVGEAGEASKKARRRYIPVFAGPHRFSPRPASAFRDRRSSHGSHREAPRDLPVC